MALGKPLWTASAIAEAQEIEHLACDGTCCGDVKRIVVIKP
jgi:hypothetical protein